jgi:hypothetical protein
MNQWSQTQRTTRNYTDQEKSFLIRVIDSQRSGSATQTLSLTPAVRSIPGAMEEKQQKSKAEG